MRFVTSLMAIGCVAGVASAEVPGVFGSVIADTNITAVPMATFLGAPDDDYAGLGNQYLTYDFAANLIIDGPGPDINIYEVDNGIIEFNLVDVLVSMDGIAFFSISSTIGDAIDLIGDDAHGSASFRRSFDLGPSGLTTVRYLKIQGTGNGAAGGQNDFDLDAVAAINFIPSPGALALMGMGGLVMTRRRR
jgi:uncharacterized protein (TIGR03382 family)